MDNIQEQLGSEYAVEFHTFYSEDNERYEEIVIICKDGKCIASTLEKPEDIINEARISL